MGNSIRLLLAILLLDLQQGSSFAEMLFSKIFLPVFQKKIPIAYLKNGCKIKFQTKKIIL